MTNEKSELYQEEKSKVLKELKEKYMFYSDFIKRNRLDIEHHKYCQQSNHSLCGAKWGHADIMREIICRMWWWFTDDKPAFVRINSKPKLQSIMENVIKQRQEGELKDAEYYWLIKIKDRCKQLLELDPVEKPKKSSKRTNSQT